MLWIKCFLNNTAYSGKQWCQFEKLIPIIIFVSNINCSTDIEESYKEFQHGMHIDVANAGVHSFSASDY